MSTPEPLDPRFNISLPDFDGPLDLLLHLIRKHELDILDLPIAFVTERYLEYVTLMEELDLDVASEYLVMAATLAYIKSRMLVPQDEAEEVEDESDEEPLDPRAELIRRLLEYQKYKAAAEELGARGVAGRDVFPRGSPAPEAGGPAPLAGTSLYRLLDAFKRVLARAQDERSFEIEGDEVNIQDRMRELVDFLRERKEARFEELFEGQRGVPAIIVTFLAILEMAKRHLLRIYQSGPIEPIHVRSTVTDIVDGGEVPSETTHWPSGDSDWGEEVAPVEPSPDEKASDARPLDFSDQDDHHTRPAPDGSGEEDEHG